MDYFFMNECMIKIIVLNHPNFILNILKTLNINVKEYELFDLEVKQKNQKIDILLFSNEIVINIELNKNEVSLKRNKIYAECLSLILPSYQIIQLNINLFNETKNSKDKNVTIYNLHNTNEYIEFLTSKNPLEYKSKNKEINKIINYFKKLDLNNFQLQILKEQKIKENLDRLLKD